MSSESATSLAAVDTRSEKLPSAVDRSANEAPMTKQSQSSHAAPNDHPSDRSRPIAAMLVRARLYLGGRKRRIPPQCRPPRSHGRYSDRRAGRCRRLQNLRSSRSLRIMMLNPRSSWTGTSIASLLWRLRRATTTETGLFEIQAHHLRRVLARSNTGRVENGPVTNLVIRNHGSPSFASRLNWALSSADRRGRPPDRLICCGCVAIE